MVMERSQWPRLRGRVGDKRATVIFKRECRPARQSRHLDAPAERRLSDFCSSTFLFIRCYFVAIDLKLPVRIETLIVQPYLSLRVMQIAHEPISRKCPAQRRLLEAEECLSCSVIVLEGRWGNTMCVSPCRARRVHPQRMLCRRCLRGSGASQRWNCFMTKRRLLDDCHTQTLE